MDTTTAKELLESKKAQTNTDTQFLALVEQLLDTGWQSDQALVDAGIASGVDAAIATAVAPLNAQIADLTAQVIALTPQS